MRKTQRKPPKPPPPEAFKGRCPRCMGHGLYADPRQVADGNRVAISMKAIEHGERTIACPVCGKSDNPVRTSHP